MSREYQEKYTFSKGEEEGDITTANIGQRFQLAIDFYLAHPKLITSILCKIASECHVHCYM